MTELTAPSDLRPTGEPGRWWAERSGLVGCVAIVVGGAGGLGEAVTLDLVANGVSVALIDRDPVAATRIQQRVAANGGRVIVRVGDAREPVELDALFAETAERWGRLDHVVNVVGGTFRGAFAEQSPGAWDALLRTNLSYVLHSISRAIPAMRAGGRGGSIVNLTTIEGHRAAPNFAVYSAAKAAVTQLSRSLAVELAPDGIRVNCVAPDLTPTPGMLGVAPGAGDASAAHPLLDEVNVGTSIPMGRVGVPADVAGAVVFLLSGMASYITGSTLHPDGGTLASSGWLNWPSSGFSNMLPPDVVGLLHTAEGSGTPGLQST